MQYRGIRLPVWPEAFRQCTTMYGNHTIFVDFCIMQKTSIKTDPMEGTVFVGRQKDRGRRREEGLETKGI